MREIHSRLPSFRQGRAIEVEINRKKRRLYCGDFKERGIGKPEPPERVVCRGNLADYVYFFTFLNNESEPVQKARSLRFSVLS